MLYMVIWWFGYRSFGYRKAYGATGKASDGIPVGDVRYQMVSQLGGLVSWSVDGRHLMLLDDRLLGDDQLSEQIASIQK